MLAHFYDIESLSNVFTLCNYRPEDPSVDVYYLCDDQWMTSDPMFEQLLLQRILDANKNFHGTIRCFDLHEEASNRHLAEHFGLSNARLVNDPSSPSSYPAEFRPVCDTDPDYDEDKHPYLFGYNSYNYDTTMLAMYLYEVFYLNNGIMEFHPAQASLMRTYNNELFSARFKDSMPTRLTQVFDAHTKSWSETNYQDDRWKIRKCMLMTGRHLDVARLNEKQQHVGLKRLIGMMGGQILESDKLKQGQDHIDDVDQLLDLVAYNVSDCVNLKEYVFDNKVYQGQFSLKRGLLKTYPELVYDRKPDAYAPDIRPNKVRRDRLTIDSSAAQLATKSLCPYDHLTDIPVVSFMYPSERKSKELGIPRVNVLEEAKKFFYSKFQQPELRAQFDRIYNYYKAIEGKNFNSSQNYSDDYAMASPWNPPENIVRFSKADTCMYYYNADGTPSSCFVTFSIGGIHGAEYNKALYEHDMDKYLEKKELMDKVKAIYPDPIDLKTAKTVTVIGPDGTELTYKASQFLKSGSTKKAAAYKDLKEPVLFKLMDDGTTKLSPAYVYTSADPTNHEDFTSYYPNLLRMMSAFYNEGLGYDRYAEIFDNKQNYGFLMKPKNADLTPEQALKYGHLRELTGLKLDPLHISDEERALYAVQREGTKLILNSASGAADANFESNIRMNNQIISMRCIGQLFSWRIGQAQTLEGARITSTNTDGLFSVLAPEINNPVLEREAASINVEIEPEPTFLISKDSNNRIEMDEETGKIQRASGGTLACRMGPDPQKSLAHPAIIDWALTEYLVIAATGYKGLSLSKPFDDEVGMNILRSAGNTFKDPAKLLNMFQNVIASSTGSISYHFATTDANPGNPIILQHYNRVFIMKDGHPGSVHLRTAVAKVVSAVTQAKRRREGDRLRINDPLALQVLAANGVAPQDISSDKEAAVKKATNIEPDWFMLVENRDLSLLDPAVQKDILDNLDYDKYLSLLRDGYETNWRNHLPGEENMTDEAGNAATDPGNDAVSPIEANVPDMAVPADPELSMAAPDDEKPAVKRKKKSAKADAHVAQTVPAGSAILFGPAEPSPQDCPFDVTPMDSDNTAVLKSEIESRIFECRQLLDRIQAVDPLTPDEYIDAIARNLKEISEIL